MRTIKKSNLSLYDCQQLIDMAKLTGKSSLYVRGVSKHLERKGWLSLNQIRVLNLIIDTRRSEPLEVIYYESKEEKEQFIY